MLSILTTEPEEDQNSTQHNNQLISQLIKAGGASSGTLAHTQPKKPSLKMTILPAARSSHQLSNVPMSCIL